MNQMMGGPNGGGGGFGPNFGADGYQQQRNGFSGNKFQENRSGQKRGRDGALVQSDSRKGEKLNLDKAAMMPPHEMLRYVQKCAHSYAAELDSRFPDCRKVMVSIFFFLHYLPN